MLEGAIEELRSRLAGDDKQVYFEVFRAHVIDPTLQGAQARLPTYQALADELDIKQSDVRNYLSYARQLLRQLLRRRIRDYVASEQEVDAELQRVLGG